MSLHNVPDFVLEIHVFDSVKTTFSVQDFHEVVHLLLDYGKVRVVLEVVGNKVSEITVSNTIVILFNITNDKSDFFLDVPIPHTFWPFFHVSSILITFIYHYFI